MGKYEQMSNMTLSSLLLTFDNSAPSILGWQPQNGLENKNTGKSYCKFKIIEDDVISRVKCVHLPEWESGCNGGIRKFFKKSDLHRNNPRKQYTTTCCVCAS